MTIYIISILKCPRSQQRRQRLFQSLSKQGIYIDLEESEALSKQYGMYDERQWQIQKNIIRSWNLTNTGVKALWLAAYDTRNVIESNHEYTYGDVTITLSDYRPAVKGGELGCWMSHRQTWKHIIEQDNNALILEDDAQLPPNFLNSLNNWLEYIPKDYEQFYLGRNYYVQKGRAYEELTFDTLSDKIHTKGEISLYKSSGNWFTHAYLISAKTAQFCLNHTKTVYCGIDDRLSQLHAHMDKVYALEPMWVKQIKTSTLIRNR